jgi:hypothetical protein
MKACVRVSRSFLLFLCSVVAGMVLNSLIMSRRLLPDLFTTGPARILPDLILDSNAVKWSGNLSLVPLEREHQTKGGRHPGNTPETAAAGPLESAAPSPSFLQRALAPSLPSNAAHGGPGRLTTSPWHFSRKDPVFYQTVTKMYKSNRCNNISTVVIAGLQETGLGSNMEALVSAAVLLAKNQVSVTFAERIPSKYFICPDGTQGFRCVFDSPCQVSQINSNRKCVVDGGKRTYISNRMIECLRPLKNINVHTPDVYPMPFMAGISDAEMKLLAHELFRLNSRMKDHVSGQMRAMGWPVGQEVTSVHVRQGHGGGKNLAWDHVRVNSHVWSTDDLCTVLVLLKFIFNTSAALLISDDEELVSTVHASISAKKFCFSDLQLDENKTLMCSVSLLPPRVLITKGAGAGIAQDCLREGPGTCTSGQMMRRQAEGAITDMFLPSFSQWFAGTMRSSYDRGIYMQMNSTAPPLNLDDLSCSNDIIANIKICAIGWWKTRPTGMDRLEKFGKSQVGIPVGFDHHRCACQLDSAHHPNMCFCAERLTHL